jgi:hypothetical protein
MTASPLGKGAAHGSPSGFLPLERAPDVMKFFIMVHSLILCLTGYAWFRQAVSRSFLKCSFGYHAWRLDILLIRAVRFFIIIVAAGSNYDTLGVPLLPLLLPLAPFLAPLLVALNSAPSYCRGPFSHRLEQRQTVQWSCFTK